MEQTHATNKMGTLPIPRLLMTMAIPLMLSMLVQAFYNIVDSFFVARIADTAAILDMGDKAVNALTLAFPIQMLIIAFNVGTGVGVNASLSKYLGEKKRGQASQVAGNALFLAVFFYLFVLLFGLFGTPFYFSTQTNDPVIAELGVSYLRIICIFSIGHIGASTFEKLLQATGKTFYSMIVQMSGAILNIILDPIMIFGWFGCPAMGVAGAAAATVIGQFIAMLLGAFYHFRYNNDIDHGLQFCRPNLPIIKRIYQVGAPAIAMQALNSVMTYGLNIVLGSISANAVTAYGVYYKLQNFIFMPAYGLNNAVIPITAFNYGAKDASRIRDSIRYGLFYVLIIMACGILLLQMFAPSLVALYPLSASAQNLCTRALRIITLGYLFSGINIILQGIYQALGNGFYSLLISLFRLVIIVLPLAWALSGLANAAEIVWIVFPIAEVCALSVAAYMMTRIRKQKIQPLEAAPASTL